MISILPNIALFIMNLFSYFFETTATRSGHFCGIFLARLWGSFLSQGVKSYRDEMARFLPQIVIHFKSCNDMLRVIIENSYTEKQQGIILGGNGKSKRIFPRKEIHRRGNRENRENSASSESSSGYDSCSQ